MRPYGYTGNFLIWQLLCVLCRFTLFFDATIACMITCTLLRRAAHKLLAELLAVYGLQHHDTLYIMISIWSPPFSCDDHVTQLCRQTCQSFAVFDFPLSKRYQPSIANYLCCHCSCHLAGEFISNNLWSERYGGAIQLENIKPIEPYLRYKDLTLILSAVHDVQWSYVSHAEVYIIIIIAWYSHRLQCIHTVLGKVHPSHELVM